MKRGESVEGPLRLHGTWIVRAALISATLMALAAAPAGGGSTVPGIRAAAQPTTAVGDESRELEVVEDYATVLLAPVVGAPGAGVLGRGDRVVVEADVYGESIDGSPRWYLVSVATEEGPARGFIHSSLVRELP
jgi:hypothetical protein